MKNTSLILTASVVTLFGIIAVSGDAVAQTPSSGIITYPTYPGSGISSCCYLTSKTDISRDSFSTIHVWKLQTPGTFAVPPPNPSPAPKESGNPNQPTPHPTSQ
jgi:hypothetical protein